MTPALRLAVGLFTVGVLAFIGMVLKAEGSALAWLLLGLAAFRVLGLFKQAWRWFGPRDQERAERRFFAGGEQEDER